MLFIGFFFLQNPITNLKRIYLVSGYLYHIFIAKDLRERFEKIAQITYLSCILTLYTLLCRESFREVFLNLLGYK